MRSEGQEPWAGWEGWEGGFEDIGVLEVMNQLMLEIAMGLEAKGGQIRRGEEVTSLGGQALPWDI